MIANIGAFTALPKALGAAALLAVLAGAPAMAQTTPSPVPAPKGTPKAAPKAAPKQAPPAPQAQPQAPAAPQQPAPPQPAAAPQQQVPIVYSPWTKICPKNQVNAQNREVCLTVKEARLESGQFLVGAALIEQAGQDKKLLRVTLPLGMQLPQGTRITLDSEQPLSGAYIVCVPNGCMADFEVNLEFVGKLKKGQQLLLQGVNMPGQVVGYPLPLADFAKANDNPPTDPEEFDRAQKQFWEEKLRQQQPAAPPK